MRMVVILLILAMLAGCSSTPAPTAPPATVASTAAWTATAVTVATNTPHPTDLPAPTSTASPAPSYTPTATSTWTPEQTATATATATGRLDAATWELPLVTAGVTLRVIDELERTAQGLQDGSLESVEAGGTLLGLKIGLGAVAQALDERPLMGRAARFEDGLRANLRTVYGIVDRWQAGELSSATVGPELARARGDVERLLSDLADAAGLTPAQVDELMAEP